MNGSKFTLLGILALPMYGQAQSLDSDSTSKYLNEVVVNALRVGHKSPFVFSNLNKDDILEKNEGKDLPYILEQTPSVLVNSDAGNGVGYTDLRVRGTDNSRINFTINGVPVNDPESQGVFFVNFPDVASSSGSIQLQRGVGSSTNGSGAFGASINVSNLEQKKQASATLINSVGSFGTLRNTLNVGTGKLNNGFQFDLRLSKIKSDGYIQRSASDLKSMQFLTGWSSKNNNTHLKFNLFTGKEKTGQAWDGVEQSQLNIDPTFNELGLKEDGTYYKNQTDNYQQDYYQIFLDQKLNANSSFNAGIFLTRGKGFYDEYKQDESYSDYGLSNPIIGNDTLSSTSLTRELWLDNYYYGGIFNYKFWNKASTLNIGGAILQYDAKHYGNINWASNGVVPQGYQWYHLTAFKTDANIYAKVEQELANKLFGTLDLQLRNVDYNINGFRKNPDVVQKNHYLFFNPKAGLSYVSGLNKLYFSFAVANKEPNRNDFEAGINDVPKAERLYDFELGYHHAEQKSDWSANLYYMNYKNQLILTGKINDVGAYTRTNVDKSYRAGIELTGKHQFYKQFGVFANLTCSQNKITSFTEYIDDYDMGGQVENEHKNTDIALSPNTIAMLGLTYSPFQLKGSDNLEFSIDGRYVSRQYLDNTSNIDRSINPFALANFKIKYETAFGKMEKVMLLASVNNLFNKAYQTKGYTYSYYYTGLQTFNFYYPQAGRNYALTLVLGF